MLRSAFRVTLVAAGLTLLATGCGARKEPAFRESRIGSGPDRVWVFEPSGRPTSLVVFVHGQGNLKETTPFYHRAWLEHLAQGGSIVLYPRYELTPGAPGAVTHIVRGVRAAAARLGAGGLPALGIGYSRGGWLVLAYATMAKESGVNLRGVMSVFPVSPELPLADLHRIPRGARIDVLAGDRDEVVGKVGAAQILTLLAYIHYPHRLTSAKLIRSHGDFVASHASALDDTPDARAAYWRRADRLLARLKSRSERS